MTVTYFFLVILKFKEYFKLHFSCLQLVLIPTWTKHICKKMGQILHRMIGRISSIDVGKHFHNKDVNILVHRKKQKLTAILNFRMVELCLYQATKLITTKSTLNRFEHSSTVYTPYNIIEHFNENINPFEHSATLHHINHTP